MNSTPKIGKELVKETLSMTQSLLQKHPARIAGTRDCLLAADSIADTMGKHCDQVEQERFALHPGSLFNIGRATALAYILSAALLYLGGICTYISLGLWLLILLYVLVHYVFYGTFFDPLFKQREGCNVTGTIEPTEGVRQQVLIVGHHDSPYVFSFLSRFERWAGIRFLMGALLYLYIGIMSVTGVYHSLYDGTWALRGTGLIVAIAGLIFIIPLYFFITKKPSPGAGDNLNASSMAIQIARYFSDQREKGAPLRHTRLVLLSTDGEEAGQRGSRAYITRHGDILAALPTYVFNIDSVYKQKDLMFITRDRHGILPLSSQMSEDCREIAAKLGYPVLCKPLPVGGGGTDAASFAAAGIEAVSLVGLPTSMISEGHIYHTLRDTVEAIEPAAVEAALHIAINYIRHRDRSL